VVRIEPTPCKFAAWPEDPEVFIFDTLPSGSVCPPDAVCLDVPSAVNIATWAEQIERMHTALLTCKAVVFYKPITDSLGEWQQRETEKIGAPATD
jgi:hypothetical protein